MQPYDRKLLQTYPYAGKNEIVKQMCHIKALLQTVEYVPPPQKVYAAFEMYRYLTSGICDTLLAHYPKFRLVVRKKWVEKSYRDTLICYDANLQAELEQKFTTTIRLIALRPDYIQQGQDFASV